MVCHSSGSAVSSCLHMTQPSAAMLWLELPLLIWPAEIQDLVYSSQKENWRWTETSSEELPLCKNIFKVLFLIHREPWTTPLTDLNIFQPAFGPYASRSKCSKSGVTPLARQRPITHHLVSFSSYLTVQSSILAEVQGWHCHPALLPTAQKAMYPSLWGWAQARLSHLSRFSQGMFNSVF